VLDRLTPRIIALGGGAWTLERNRDLINEHRCLTVFIDASYDLCWQRITDHPVPRPFALDEPSTRQLYRERHALYALADIRIEVTGTMSADEVAVKIVEEIKRKEPAR
jgi:shikimate kinase